MLKIILAQYIIIADLMHSLVYYIIHNQARQATI